MASSSSPLPSEIIFEILTRTSLKTLDECKAVNKECHDIVFESNFMPQFCQRSQNISGYFVQTLLNNKHVTEFVSMDGCSGNTKPPFHLPINDITAMPCGDFDMKIVASTKQGILCCVRRIGSRYRYYICKPSTKQWIKLPNPRVRFETVKVALIVLKSNPLHFKIIRLSSPRTSYHHYRVLGKDYYRREVFDSEHWKWKQEKDLLVPEFLCFDMFAPAVNASGLVYFKLRDDLVMALDYNGEEAFPRFSLPNQAFDYEDYRYNQLVEYNGKLGFICLSPRGIGLWVFENENHVWELKQEVGIESIKEMTNFPTPSGIYNAGIALMKDYYKVYFYKLQDKSFNEVKLNKCRGVQEVFPFRSDLEPVDLSMLRTNNHFH
ncbi:hypothetical protein RDI58_018975 [Solanum bulbocastanum]|uniref:F-box associated beta-propeller type 3 domain-containing protein n=1 Tax=Solanum bulbocastanum TaxID=147425 RepID=A0AAN8TE66_SOLBU